MIEQILVASMVANAASRPPLTTKRQHGAATPALLRHRSERMLWVRSQPRVVHTHNSRLSSSQRASVIARSLCACRRIDSVSSPFSTTKALNGDSLMSGAAHRRHEPGFEQLGRARRRRRRDPALAIEVLGTRMHHQVGAELHRLLQRREQKQLSTTSKAPPACAISANAAMSLTAVSGCSAFGKSSLVCGRIASRQAVVSVCRQSWSGPPNLAKSWNS